VPPPLLNWGNILIPTRCPLIPTGHSKSEMWRVLIDRTFQRCRRRSVYCSLGTVWSIATAILTDIPKLVYLYDVSTIKDGTLNFSILGHKIEEKVSQINHFTFKTSSLLKYTALLLANMETTGKLELCLYNWKVQNYICANIHFFTFCITLKWSRKKRIKMVTAGF
jgi:hypothetical protein